MKTTKWGDKVPDDFFLGEPNHPVCTWFEALQGTTDPYDDYLCMPACHLVGCQLEDNPAKVCKGDYLICPLQYGKIFTLPRKKESEDE